MSNHLQIAETQARGIGAAINGDSSAVQILGSMGRDPHPERLLAVGLAHSMNTFGALIDATRELEATVASLRSEVAQLKAKQRR